MKNHGFRFLVILGIIAFCVWQIAAKGIRRGLDLDGGSSLTYTAKADEEITREKLQKAIEVITKRVNATGLTEIFITSTANNEILVEMPRRSKDEIEAVKQLIQRNGQLEFRIEAELAETTKEREAREQSPPKIYERNLETKGRRWVPLTDDESSQGHRGGAKDVLVLTPETPLWKKYQDLKAAKGEDAEDTRQALGEFENMRRAEVFRGEDMETPYLTMEGTQIVVGFSFKDARKNDFKEFTTRNLKRPMAIILDGKIDSSPTINSVLPGRGIIEGGGARGFTEKEANELRIVLESGSTGLQLQLEREETLGASLGQVAIERGQFSIAVGFLAVVLAMVWYYRVPGLIAIFALSLNVLITLAALAWFRGALSLPGIAGIVLGLGLSIDANILIFERLRDERQRGKRLAESLAAGYDNAMSAIIDGNITALLSAFVLIALGTGAVRGFGVTLTIGLLSSMFTAVWVTRCIFDFAIEKGWLKNFNIGKDPKEPTLDYMKGRRFYVMPSLILIVASIVGFLLRDDEKSKDLEFIGGQQVIVQLTKPLSADQIAEIAKGPDNRWEDATAVRLDPEGSVPAGTSNRWQVRVKATSEAKGREYVDYLRERLKDDFVPPGFAKWTPVPAKQGERPRTSVEVHTLSPVGDVAELRTALEKRGLGAPEVTVPEGGDGHTLTITVATPEGGDVAVQEGVRKALGALAKPLQLSEPMPSLAYLSPVQAEAQWQNALRAVLLSLLFQVIYIRVRFADYTHGFAAAIALVHDAVVTLGAVALFDSLGLVYAKINLVVIAAFLSLIGDSMNDTIVIFDRIRENLGRGKVIRSKMINDSINQTFSRSVRTSVIVFLTVLVQFVFNRNLGSAIEGFAFVQVVGTVAGAYSSYFMSPPLLLFLPGYSRRLMSNRILFAAMCVAAFVGALLASTAKGHDSQMWIGIALAAPIPLHFLSHFVRWLWHPDPDSLVIEEAEAVADEPPLVTPGV